LSREWRLFLEDILSSCGKIRRYAEGSDLAALKRDEKTLWDVVSQRIPALEQELRRFLGTGDGGPAGRRC